MECENKKKSLVITLHDDTKEITQLSESLGYTVVHTCIQNRNLPDVRTYLGSGKLNEIKQYLENHCNITLIIVDGELRPSQWFLLEKELHVEVYDRIKLILMIFKKRANRKEAKLQVRLAELEYEKPYVKELIHRTRNGEHPGFMSGGEYQVDDYFRIMKKQMKLIKSKLQKIEKDHEVQRKYRHKTGFYQVSLAGYTNAGKSSLLNCLTNNEIAVRNQLFSTLSTTTRKIDTNKIPILLNDTVGFIENLPSWIIKAFHSTLEEIKKADLVILVVDISDPFGIFIKKFKTSLDELHHLEVTSNVIIALNKSDLLTKQEIDELDIKLKELLPFKNMEFVFLSVKEDLGIDFLLEKIIQSLPNIIQLTIELPQIEEVFSFISWLYEKTYIINITYGKKIQITLKCNGQLKNKIDDFCMKYNGRNI